MTDWSPDLLVAAAESAGYDPDSFAAGYRLSLNAKLLAEVAANQGQARLTTLATLRHPLEVLAAHVDYEVQDEGVPCADPAGVSLVLTPRELHEDERLHQ